ncbi:MAG: hypothetical protein H8E14_11915 [Candidatus Marinimicrobia bacterium]|nr:hypothetical protein [Candidatus Neomarinimicrobiota bacterium]
MRNNKPIKSFKVGAVKTSVFENQYERQETVSTVYRVVLDRSYKDLDGKWKSTNSFTAERDLPKAILVLQRHLNSRLLKTAMTVEMILKDNSL